MMKPIRVGNLNLTTYGTFRARWGADTSESHGANKGRAQSCVVISCFPAIRGALLRGIVTSDHQMIQAIEPLNGELLESESIGVPVRNMKKTKNGMESQDRCIRRLKSAIESNGRRQDKNRPKAPTHHTVHVDLARDCIVPVNQSSAMSEWLC